MGKYFYSVLYAFSTALSPLLIEKAGRFLPPTLTLLISTLFAVLFFHIVNINSIKDLYKKIFQEYKNWIACCIVIAIIWLATFYGINYVGGFIYLFVYFISAAIISYTILMTHKQSSYYKLVSNLGLTITLIVFIYIAAPHQNALHYKYGILLGLIGGISSYIYRKLSYTVAIKCHLTAGQVLAVRSYGIILLTLILIPRADYAMLNFKSVLYTIIIAIFSFILPLYSNQKGIMRAGSEVHSIIAASCPFITCLLTFGVHHFFTPIFFISSIISFLLMILGMINNKPQALPPK